MDNMIMKLLLASTLTLCFLQIITNVQGRAASAYHHIPSTAKPGYIVTRLPHSDVHYTQMSLKHSPLEGRDSLFSITPNGEIVTKELLPRMEDTKLPLYIHSKLHGSKWNEVIHLHISDNIDAFHFKHQPYHGFIDENNSPGEPVSGLEEFISDLKNLPGNCRIDINRNQDLPLALKRIVNGFDLISVKSFDRESVESMSVQFAAVCPTSETVYAEATVTIRDENDEKPKFKKEKYSATLIPNLPVGIKVAEISAVDEDKSDKITYHLNSHSDIFEIDSSSGVVTLKSPSLKAGELTVEIIAVDTVGHVSDPALLIIDVLPTLKSRTKRAVRDPRLWVIRRQEEGELFSVASIPNDEEEQFSFVDKPDGLTINTTNGMVSKDLGYVWTVDEIDFQVNITKTTDPTYTELLDVKLHIVDRGDFDPIFTDIPRTLTTTIPVWIRPFTVIYTVHAKDVQEFGAKVVYAIETGAYNSFAIDSSTGDLYVIGRRKFEEGRVYELAISARCEGGAFKEATPSQIVRVIVGEQPPQLYMDPYEIHMPETTSQGGMVVQVQAVSFQNLPLEYSLEAVESDADGRFSINRDSGEVTLNTALVYVKDPWRYVLRVSVKEDYTDLISTTEFVVYLKPENRNAPYFTLSHYVAENIPENVGVGISLLELTAVDIDPGILGEVYFNVSDDHFRVTTTDNKVGFLEPADGLDYDLLPDRMYEFVVTATDMGEPPLSGSSTVQVYMTNVNDENPVPQPTEQVVSLKEEARTGLLAHVIQAYDPDGSGLSFTFTRDTSREATDMFDLIQSTGELVLKKDLSRDLTNFNFTVDITDDASCCGGSQPFNTATVTIVVEFIGVNHQPVFKNCSTYSPSIEEMLAPGFNVLTMTATDDDSGDNGDVSCSILYQETETKWFEVENDPNDNKVCHLKLARQIDREALINNVPREAVKNEGKLNFKATIKVEDKGNPPLNDVCFFFVKILDVNDNAPLFDRSPYDGVILRGTARDETVLRVLAVDDDEDPTVRYDIVSSSCQNCLEIDSVTGVIKKGPGSVDSVNEVTLEVRARDDDNVHETRVNVIIQITDSNNELLPEWELINGQPIDDITVIIQENITVGSNLDVTLRATGRGGLSYSLDKGRSPMENLFQDFRSSPSGGSTGIIVAQNLDYEKTSDYILLITAAEQETGAKAAITRLHVEIRDVNDNIPYFVGQDVLTGQYSKKLLEDWPPNAVFLTVTAVDGDGTSPNNLVTYSFNPSCEDCSDFNIDPNTGDISSTVDFDRDTKDSYFLLVVAEDGAPSSISPPSPNRAEIGVVLEITSVSLNPPYFSEDLYETDVQEDVSLHSEIVRAIAVDQDPGLTAMQYAIVGGNNERAFYVEEGIIKNSLFLFYKETPMYSLTLRIFDGVDSDTTRINITLTQVNRFAPVFSPLEVVGETVQEKDNSIAYPKVMEQVSATDPDTGSSAQITYNVAGALSHSFNIDNQGDIYLTRAIDRDYPDGHAEWWINAVATDGTGPGRKEGYGLVVVKPTDINDNAPIFLIESLSGTVMEDASRGNVFMRLSAVDYDEGNNSLVEFNEIDIPGDGGSPIFIVETNGNVVLALDDVLDREKLDTYEAVVEARDKGVPPLSASATITIMVGDVNEHPPVLESDSYTFSMDEALPIGSSVYEIIASDNDTGVNAKLTFEIIGDEGRDLFMDSIYVSQTGVIKIAKVFDFETMTDKTLSFTVQVRDPDFSDSATVSITVNDVNDNAPDFGGSRVQNATVSEDAEIGYTVALVTATDADSGINGEFEFIIDYQHSDPNFQFQVSDNGASVSTTVTVRNPLDRETQDYYELHVLAIDKGEPAQTGTATIYISIADVNDNAPDFSDMYMPVVKKDARPNDVVFEFSVSDADLPENGPPFTVDLQYTGIGTIRAARPDGYKRNELGISSYELRFRMQDNPVSGEAQMEAVRTLTIIIEDDNYNMHKEGHKDIEVYNYKGRFPSTIIGKVYVEDPDDWDLPYKTFRWMDESHQWFELDEENGDVTLKQGAPPGTYNLQFTVSDSKFDRSASATLTVIVNYISDEAVQSSGSIRLEGITSEEFVERGVSSNSLAGTKMDVLRTNMANLLTVPADNVEIFGIKDVPGEEKMVDVMFAAHGSPYYSDARLNALVQANKDEFERDLGASIGMSPVDLCTKEFKSCWDTGCTTERDIADTPNVVNTNQTAFVGLDVTYRQQCTCQSDAPKDNLNSCGAYSCLNGGTCKEDWSGFVCACPDGFEGPRCQMTKVSFNGAGWAYYPPLKACVDSRLSFDFATSAPQALLLYNGPFADTEPENDRDFIAVMLQDGFPLVRVNFGDDEVTVSFEGTTMKNDGNWHHIEITMKDKMVQVIVDYCRDATVTETIDSSESDRDACERRATATGEHMFLNVQTPLELGGRSKPNVNYPDLPSGIGGLNGCIRNVQYDKTSTGAENGCSLENCQCSGNSTCVGDDMNSLTCRCKPGYTGQNCNEVVEVADFGDSPSFINWRMENGTVLDSSQTSLQLMFRTRQSTGIIFTVESFSTLERMQLLIEDAVLVLRYDLGAGYRFLSLPDVRIDDGIWHTVRIDRHGTQARLILDHGDGQYYDEREAVDEHRLLRVSDLDSGAAAGAYVTYNRYTGNPEVADDFLFSCVQDIRYMDVMMPVDMDGSSSIADVVEIRNVDDRCESTACVGVTCPTGQRCFDMWRYHECVCEDPTLIKDPNDQDLCIVNPVCTDDYCVHGWCVFVDGVKQCHCLDGYIGDRCDQKAPVVAPASATLSTGATVSIVVAIIALLLLILIFILLTRKKKPDQYLIEPDDDWREDYVNYEEEGAGEEDMHAYDLSRLQKPVDPNLDPNSLAPRPDEPIHRREIPLTAPEPMHAGRPYPPPGDNPDVGDFIDDRLKDADHDPNAPPYDSVREYEYEGTGSLAGSLSSLQSSSSGDQNYDYLNDFGPRFKKLADLYGGGEEED